MWVGFTLSCSSLVEPPCYVITSYHILYIIRCSLFEQLVPSFCSPFALVGCTHMYPCDDIFGAWTCQQNIYTATEGNKITKVLRNTYVYETDIHSIECIHICIVDFHGLLFSPTKPSTLWKKISHCIDQTVLPEK